MKLAFLFLIFGFVPGLANATLGILDINPVKSNITGLVHRSGLLSFFGHEHAVTIPRWASQIQFDVADPAHAQIEIRIPTLSLDIDTPAGREEAGLGGGPSAEDVVKIKERMLGPEVLDASKYPVISFRSTLVKVIDRQSLQIQGLLSLHGVSQTVSIPVKYEVNSEMKYHFTGSFSLKLSDYGIKAPSTAGVVNVKDEMDIRFDIWTQSQTAVAKTQ